MVLLSLGLHLGTRRPRAARTIVASLRARRPRCLAVACAQVKRDNRHVQRRDGSASRISPCGGAEEGTRTLTRLPSLAPQASVSTNSTTSARRPAQPRGARGSAILQAGDAATRRLADAESAWCGMLGGAVRCEVGHATPLRTDLGAGFAPVRELERQLRPLTEATAPIPWVFPPRPFSSASPSS